MSIFFTTPIDVVADDFTIEDIVIPEGSELEETGVNYLETTENMRKKWGLRVWYTNFATGDVSSFTFKVRDEIYHIASVYERMV